MSTVAVVYWSGTGNTEAMAVKIAEGATAKGAQVSTFTAGEFPVANVASYDAFAFGCPSMGAEVLEEDEFQPMWDAVKNSLNGKKVVLFGSYGWGDGEWMRTWEEECTCDVQESFICNETPGADELEKCVALGESLA